MDTFEAPIIALTAFATGILIGAIMAGCVSQSTFAKTECAQFNATTGIFEIIIKGTK